jgi:hypothetical protein
MLFVCGLSVTISYQLCVIMQELIKMIHIMLACCSEALICNAHTMSLAQSFFAVWKITKDALHRARSISGDDAFRRLTRVGVGVGASDSIVAQHVLLLQSLVWKLELSDCPAIIDDLKSEAFVAILSRTVLSSWTGDVVRVDGTVSTFSGA